MPPPEPEDFDAYAKRRGWQPEDAEAGDFDAYAKRRGWAPADEPEVAPEDSAPADEPGTGEDWLDFLLGGVEGATFGGMRSLGGAPGQVLSRLGPTARVFDEHDENAARALETPAGKVGQVAGRMGAGLALGGAAGPGVAAQAASGAVTGGAAAADESDGDWLATLAGMGSGGLFGAAGGALASRVGARPTLKQVGSSALVGAGLGAATSPGDPIMGAGAGALHGAGGRMLMGALPQSFGAPVRALGQLAAAGAGTASGALAQEPEVAYGTAPTMAWAVQSALTSGDSGLSPEDEQRLTEALLDGDEDKVISANFALQMKNPGWSARLQRELESLQEEE